jgi:hypothetical protein
MGAPIGNKNAAGGKRIKGYARQLVEADDTLIPRMLLAMAEKACNGDVAAFNAFCDRYDGKVAQAIVGDDDEPGINIKEIVIRAIKPTA